MSGGVAARGAVDDRTVDIEGHATASACPDGGHQIERVEGFTPSPSSISPTARSGVPIPRLPTGSP